MSVALQPLSSFSANDRVADALFSRGGEYQLFVSARVPVSRILSTAQTGFGAKHEAEMVVLGAAENPVWFSAYAPPEVLP